MHSVSPNAKLKYGNVFIRLTLALLIGNQLMVIFLIASLTPTQVSESTHEVEKGEQNQR